MTLDTKLGLLVELSAKMKEHAGKATFFDRLREAAIQGSLQQTALGCEMDRHCDMELGYRDLIAAIEAGVVGLPEEGEDES